MSDIHIVEQRLILVDRVCNTEFVAILRKFVTHGEICAVVRFLSRAILLTRIRRSYRDDFRNQYSQYQAFLQLFMQAPTTTDDKGLISLRELIDFVAHTADCFPDVTKTFPDDLTAILNLHHAELESELRDKIVGSLVLLRKKEIIDSATYVVVLAVACCEFVAD